VRRGEAIGIVGESGSGKSMLALSILGLVGPPATVSGEIEIEGHSVLASGTDLHRLRGRVAGLILQDPTASLNPVRTIRSQLAESARVAGMAGPAIREAIDHALSAVGLDPKEVLRRYPFELSGGMNQRVAIAIALVQRPAILIADEPTTALDVSTQLSILALLQSLQRQFDMAIVLISHDLAVVYQLAHRLAVMYAGKLVEVGTTDEVVGRPQHPYTQALIGAIPSLGDLDRPLRTIPGQLQATFDDSRGCPFADRCPEAMDLCRQSFPETSVFSPTHRAWCWLHRPQAETG
jgi:oligopeptide/dipeptide ABC transporter ATP-binding protein